MQRRSIQVPPGRTGAAVARIVHEGLDVSHATAKGLIDAGCVTINGRPARIHGQRCEGGDVVEVKFDPSRRYHPLPHSRGGEGFQVLHEDREIVVVNKRPGMLSAPVEGAGEASLAESIARSLRERGFRKPQLFVVHRLDRHTSGLLVFAKTPRALESLIAQFESRLASREYTAIVTGRPRMDRGRIESWLVEDPKSLSVRTTQIRGAGKRASTHFKVLERYPSASLLRVTLETGRKHQIRVHLAEIGHPVIGDRRYGTRSDLIGRVALHAARLTFKHPRTLETARFEAAMPGDLEELVRRLRRADRPAAEVAPPFETRPGPAAVLPRGLTLAEDRAAEPRKAPAADSVMHPKRWAERVRVRGASQSEGEDRRSRKGGDRRGPSSAAQGVRSRGKGAGSSGREDRQARREPARRETGIRDGGSRPAGGDADSGARRPGAARQRGERPSRPLLGRDAGAPPRPGPPEARREWLLKQRAVPGGYRRRGPPEKNRPSRPPSRDPNAAAGPKGRPSRAEGRFEAREKTGGASGEAADRAERAKAAPPWEFRQKGLTRRRERRRKIAAAQSRKRKRE